MAIVSRLPAFLLVDNVTQGTGRGCCGIIVMSLEGMISSTVVDTQVDQQIMLANLKNEVLPHLNAYPQPRSVLIMDNAPTHDHLLIHDECSKVGVICIFLPPYSYDYNPIELAFHQTKKFLRCKYMDNAVVNKDRLLEGIACVQVEDVVNYYKHCGYNIEREDLDWVEL